MIPYLRFAALAASITGVLCSAVMAAESPSTTGKPLLEPDRGGVELSPPDWQDPGKGPLKGSGWVEFDFEVPADGWYNLFLQNNPEIAREIFVDGERVSLAFGASPKSAAELLGIPLESITTDGWSKETNLALKAGKHTLRIERVGRMGHPQGMARAWEIRPAAEGAAHRLRARVDGPLERRKGEKLPVILTGGHGPATEIELVRINLETGASQTVAKVAFPASERFEQRRVEIPADEEGAFSLHAKANGKLLSRGEFLAGTYYVIDTEHRPQAKAGADAPMELVYEIDCVAGTLNGAPVEKGVNFWEANGASRVSESPAGRYREGGDGLGPETNPNAVTEIHNFSGFAYLFDLPQAGVPYVIEIDHPDDDWRSVCVSIVDVLDKEKKTGYLPPTFAWETGGNLPLSNRMLTERVMFWPNGKAMHLGLTSGRIGKRAAASRIRVYRVTGPLPAQVRADSAQGRLVGLYMEEPKRWHTHFNTPEGIDPALRHYIGLQRTIQWAAYTGMNAFWPSVVAYQEATYDSQVLKGYLLGDNHLPRLSALMCEKYGLGYVGEIFLARQRYFNAHVMTEGAADPSECYTTSWWGYNGGEARNRGGLFPLWNILHPHVQQRMIDIYGELADSLADTRSFVGLAGRLDSWNWDGLYGLTSLNWGYEDWTIGQFEADTGVRVPGAADDPARFEKRYGFLTAEPMRAQWIAWRKGRVSDYLRRLAARIGKNHPGALLFLCGNARTDEAHQPNVPESIAQRLDEMGIDLATLGKEETIAFLPAGGYGRGKTRTYLADQDAYDKFSDPEYIASGFNRIRGYAPFGLYQEHGDEFPLAELGMPLKRWWYCSSSDAAGDAALERFSTVLAEQDTMIFRDGGYPLLPGRRDAWSRWMAEFSSLPRVPFAPVPLARDPVALWSHAGKSAFLFYAVNRERYPVEITLKLENAPTLTRLGTGETIRPENGTLTLRLEPWELRAFSAPKRGAIAEAHTSVPQEAIRFVRERLAFAEDCRKEMESGAFRQSFTPEEKAVFSRHLETAWEALSHDAWWRARTVLSSAPMMAVYEKLGNYPARQVEARFPDRLEPLKADRFDPDEPFLDAAALEPLVLAESGAAMARSEEFNPLWSFVKVIRSGPEGIVLELDVPAPGPYRLSVGHVAEKPGTMAVTLNGRSLPVPMVSGGGGTPEKTVYPAVTLPKGKVRLSIERPDPFGLYAVRLSPGLRPLSTTLWSSVGPFASHWSAHLGAESDAAVRKGMEEVYPPQTDPSPDAVYRNGAGEELRWRQATEIIGKNEEKGVNFSPRAGIVKNDFGFAQTFITSPDERDALLYIGTDWWANAYLNGELLKPGGDRASQEATGAWFNRWKPRPVPIRLKKGVNRLLIKNQGGSMQCWFTAFLTDADDLGVSALPPKP